MPTAKQEALAGKLAEAINDATGGDVLGWELQEPNPPDHLKKVLLLRVSPALLKEELQSLRVILRPIVESYDFDMCSLRGKGLALRVIIAEKTPDKNTPAFMSVKKRGWRV